MRQRLKAMKPRTQLGSKKGGHKMAKSRQYNRLGQRLKPLLALAVATASTFLMAGNANAWGPTRDTFTMKKPASYVTFNSITDDPSWGDERNFVDIKDVTGQENNGTTASAKGFGDTAKATENHTYMVRMFVHNNAAANLGLKATNTHVMTYIPSAGDTTINIQGTLAADNCGASKSNSSGSACAFWDDAYLLSDDGKTEYQASYVSGSARYYNNVKDFKSEGFTLSNNIIKQNGAQVGYESMNGEILGCFQYSGYVTFEVKVTKLASSFSVTKKAHIVGNNNWSSTVNAKPGDTIEYQIEYDNVAGNTQSDVIVKDTMAKNTASLISNGSTSGSTATENAASTVGLDYVKGSASLKNGNFPNGKTVDNDEWVSKGLNIGSYAVGANAKVTYQAKVPDESKLQCGENTFENVAIVETADGSKIATNQVKVNKTCTNPSVPGKSTKVPGVPSAGSKIRNAIISLTLLIALSTIVVTCLIRKNRQEKEE